MLAVLRSGCTYVPMSWDAPEERVRHVVDDCTPRLCIADVVKCSKRRTIGIGQALAITIDELLSAYAAPRTSPRPINEGDEAYIIYTSGSTGRPKGVPITHAALTNHMLGCMQVMNTNPVKNFSGVLASSSGFDVSVWETFYVLWQGGTLHVLPPEILNDARIMADYFYDNQLTSACIRPPMLSGIAAA